ncbi:MAG: molybdenum cofactor biosynthesis protein MoaE [Verrucomicrobiales bacterium]|nr:molybdenum cofactor biosynthesis protein MoaE [Verrucomicrobiales bacterium]
MVSLSLSEAPIDPAEFPPGDGCGAEVRFVGVVRGTENGKSIAGIDYSAYLPMAQGVLEQITADLTRQHGPHPLRLHHRLGFVPAGEPSVVIAVGATHSREAFLLCHDYLRRVKAEAPIWKKFIHSS